MNRVRPGVVALCLLVAIAGLAALPAAAYASGDGGDKPASSDEAAAQPDATVAAAQAAAEADPSIAAVLAGTDSTVEAEAWGGTDGEPAGTTLVYRWAAARAKAIDEEWPLLRTGDGTPEPPYDFSAYRIRASDVTALRVDVLADGTRTLQVMPVDGETRFTLQEQTWAPFSWFPWFTAKPWMLAPVFVGLALLLMARAWRRSRAWNRRLPSMTRHDRQFIARRGRTGSSSSRGSPGSSTRAGTRRRARRWARAPPPPARSPRCRCCSSRRASSSPGSSSSSAPRPGAARGGCSPLLCAAASVYFLASAMTGATTNLNLSYYVLLGCSPSSPSRGLSPPARWAGAATPGRSTADAARVGRRRPDLSARSARSRCRPGPRRTRGGGRRPPPARTARA